MPAPVMAAALLLSFAVETPLAQQPPTESNPVTWSLTAPPRSPHVGDTLSLTLTASIEPGWHVYSLTQIEEGPFALRIRVTGDATVASAGNATGPAPERQPTSTFGVPVEWYSGQPRFRVPLRVLTPNSGKPITSVIARLGVRYQACSATLCLPPKTIDVERRLAVRVR